MDKETEIFRDNIDSWVKEIKREFSDFEKVSVQRGDCLLENIFDLQDQVEELKTEISALKLIQIINLREQQRVKQ